MQNADLGRVAQRLINNAIALGQTKQPSELLFGSISVHIEMQSNLLETDGHILGHTKCAAKIEIALGANPCAT